MASILEPCVRPDELMWSSYFPGQYFCSHSNAKLHSACHEVCQVRVFCIDADDQGPIKTWPWLCRDACPHKAALTLFVLPHFWLMVPEQAPAAMHLGLLGHARPNNRRAWCPHAWHIRYKTSPFGMFVTHGGGLLHSSVTEACT